jgi:ubiquinone/menaquinone biosynthesis C-methylase UbiE
MEDKTHITIKAYDENAERFEEMFMDLHLYKDSFKQFLIRLKPGDKILDLGCGPGNVSKYLLENIPSLSITGVDLSEEMVGLAKMNVPNATFEKKDVRHLEFDPKTFDGIVAAFCLPFLYDEEAAKFIQSIALFTKTGGHIYLSTMMGSGYQFEIPSFSSGGKMFFNYYSQDFLVHEFDANGLKVLDYSVQDYVNKDGTILKDMIFTLQKGHTISE